jgi:hypothetical protein
VGLGGRPLRLGVCKPLLLAADDADPGGKIGRAVGDINGCPPSFVILYVISAGSLTFL